MFKTIVRKTREALSAKEMLGVLTAWRDADYRGSISPHRMEAAVKLRDDLLRALGR